MSVKKTSVCDSPVFQEIFEKYAQTLRNFIYYKCGDVDQAQDLVQDAYIKLWDNCAKVAPEKAKSFLYTVATNLFLNQIEHKKVVLRHQNSQPDAYDNQSPDFLLQEKEFKVKVENAIADLPQGQREVFLLSRIDKKTYKEIADITGISVKAVEKRMHKALLVIREKIGNI